MRHKRLPMALAVLALVLALMVPAIAEQPITQIRIEDGFISHSIDGGQNWLSGLPEGATITVSMSGEEEKPELNLEALPVLVDEAGKASEKGFFVKAGETVSFSQYISESTAPITQTVTVVAGMEACPYCMALHGGTMSEAAAIGVIGGADGPTSVYVTVNDGSETNTEPEDGSLPLIEEEATVLTEEPVAEERAYAVTEAEPVEKAQAEEEQDVNAPVIQVGPVIREQPVAEEESFVVEEPVAIAEPIEPEAAIVQEVSIVQETPIEESMPLIVVEAAGRAQNPVAEEPAIQEAEPEAEIIETVETPSEPEPEEVEPVITTTEEPKLEDVPVIEIMPGIENVPAIEIVPAIESVGVSANEPVVIESRELEEPTEPIIAIQTEVAIAIPGQTSAVEATAQTFAEPQVVTALEQVSEPTDEFEPISESTPVEQDLQEEHIPAIATGDGPEIVISMNPADETRQIAIVQNAPIEAVEASVEEPTQPIEAEAQPVPMQGGMQQVLVWQDMNGNLIFSLDNGITWTSQLPQDMIPGVAVQTP